jgi:hypothetical protein
VLWLGPFVAVWIRVLSYCLSCPSPDDELSGCDNSRPVWTFWPRICLSAMR